MPKLTEVSVHIQQEFANLEEDFKNAVRHMETVATRIDNFKTLFSSMHKQIENEAIPNPEVNATNPPETPAPPQPQNNPTPAA